MNNDGRTFVADFIQQDQKDSLFCGKQRTTMRKAVFVRHETARTKIQSVVRDFQVEFNQAMRDLDPDSRMANNVTFRGDAIDEHLAKSIKSGILLNDAINEDPSLLKHQFSLIAMLTPNTGQHFFKSRVDEARELIGLDSSEKRVKDVTKRGHGIYIGGHITTARHVGEAIANYFVFLESKLPEIRNSECGKHLLSFDKLLALPQGRKWAQHFEPTHPYLGIHLMCIAQDILNQYTRLGNRGDLQSALEAQQPLPLSPYLHANKCADHIIYNFQASFLQSFAADLFVPPPMVVYALS